MSAQAGFRLRGRVQGVGFRWWVQREATRLGLEGSVRNLSDGAVEVHLRGAAPQVEEMTRLLRAGPPAARVDEVTPVPFEAPEQTAFTILR